MILSVSLMSLRLITMPICLFLALRASLSLGTALSKTSVTGWSTKKAALGGIVHQGCSSSAHMLVGEEKIGCRKKISSMSSKMIAHCLAHKWMKHFWMEFTFTCISFHLSEVVYWPRPAFGILGDLLSFSTMKWEAQATSQPSNCLMCDKISLSGSIPISKPNVGTIWMTYCALIKV